MLQKINEANKHNRFGSEIMITHETEPIFYRRRFITIKPTNLCINMSLHLINPVTDRINYGVSRQIFNRINRLFDQMKRKECE